MKRSICITLALVMLLGMAACGKNVKIDKSGEMENETIFDIGDMFASINEDENEVVISSYSGSKSSVRIPDTVDGIPVVGIAATTFACTPLKKVVFGENLYYIEDYAFQETEIKKIEIPEGITYLGDGLFYNCPNLKEVTLPESLKTVGSNIFEGIANTVTVNVARGSVADEYCSALLDEGVGLIIDRREPTEDNSKQKADGTQQEAKAD